MFKSWKTSLIGLGIGVGNAVLSGGFQTAEGKFDWKSLLFSSGVAALGVFSKDHDISGGKRT